MNTNLSMVKTLKSGRHPRKIVVLVGALLLCSGMVASAQQAPEESDVLIEKMLVATADGTVASGQTKALGSITVRGSSVMSPSGVMAFGDDMFGVMTERQFKNAPYSALAVTEKVQVLRDGNELRQATSKRLYRDAAGRTRDETVNAGGEVTSVRIVDAAEAGVSHVLKPKSKTATKLMWMGRTMSNMDPLVQKKVDEALAKLKTNEGAGGSLTTGSGSVGDPRITVMRSDSPSRSNTIIEVKAGEVLMMDHADDGKVVMMTSADGSVTAPKRTKSLIVKRGLLGELESGGFDINTSEILTSALRDASFAKTAVKTSLGSRDFFGVRAEGSLSTYTIPANAIGNRHAIVVTDEIWRSPELKLVVYSKRSDPREGDTIYRLDNIQRSEQPRNLFMVPADYKVIEPSMSINKALSPK